MKAIGAVVASALCAAGTQGSQVGRENRALPIPLTSGLRKIVSVPFVRPPVVKGEVVSTGTTSIETVGGLVNGEFNETGGDNKFEFELTSGTHIGLVLRVLSNSTTTVYLDGPLPANILQDTTFVVRKSWTPGSLFGTNNTQVLAKGLKTSSAPTLATQVGLFDPTANAFAMQLFFRSASHEWRITSAPSTVTNLFDVRLGPQNVFFLTQGGGAGATKILLTGEYRKTRALVKVGGAGSNARGLLANPNTLAMTLNSSGMRNVFGQSSSSNSVDEGPINTQADEVTKFNGAANTVSNYYFRTASSAWLRSGTTSGDLGGTPIEPGEGMLFKRNPVGTAYIAIDPQFNE